MFGLADVDTHQCGFLRFGAICSNWQASSEIGANFFYFTMDTPNSLENT